MQDNKYSQFEKFNKYITALKLLNDLEQNLNLKKDETFPEFDEKLLALFKK